MRISRTSVALGAVAAVLIGAGIPALGQEKPESILPPGFGDPVATPTPAPAASATPRRPLVLPDLVAEPTAPGVPPPAATPTPGATATPMPAPTIDPAVLAQYEMPDYARRSLAVVGAAGPAEGALGPAAFGASSGSYLETLMRRLDAPIASRWLAIALRRALVSRVDTPAGVNGADFAAERAWLLLRMGEAVAARGVVQSVDTENYTPKMYQVAMQVALATGDPAALCGIADTGSSVSPERGWVMARAMCAGLSGNAAAAKAMVAAARKSGVAGGIDLLLAQRIAGVGSQAVTIEWDSVDQLTAWRYGLAIATGVKIPDELFATVQPDVQSWRALSPYLSAQDRVAAAEQAAVRGVFSNAALVDLYGAADAEDDQSLAASGVAGDLRNAYAAADAKGRLESLRQLWDGGKTPDEHYARLILTARAAARIPVGTKGADIDRLVASMLTAGLDHAAAHWRDAAPRGGDAWALIALTDPATPGLSYSDVGRYSSAKDPDGLKRRMFFAGLAGLGRLPAADVESGARSLGVPIGASNAWTQAIGRAASAHEQGTVLLLAATGMQTRLWRGVSPEALYHVVASLHAVGMDGEARMIAAEALARL